MSLKHRANQWLSRRNILLGGTAVAVISTAASVATAASRTADETKSLAHGVEHDHHARVEESLAKQDIAELRRLYAHATDLIGLNTKEAIAEGRAIYHRVFTSDATIGATGQPRVVGPDAWVKVANDALKIYQDTQHLVGTQLVSIQQMPNKQGAGGSASMSSYLQAWHAKADGEVWIFIGTYKDKLRYTPGVGWQVEDMELTQVSGDRRQLGEA